MGEMRSLSEKARAAARVLATVPTEKKNAALHGMASLLRERAGEIVAANAKDVGNAGDLSSAMQDRLELDEKRLARLEDRIGTAPRELSPYHHVAAGAPPAEIGRASCRERV